LSRLSDVVELLANRMGYDLTAKWRRDQLPLARKLRQVFAHHAIESVLDIGANEGQHAAFLRDFAGFPGRIVSFEPDPDLAGPLATRAAGDPLWTSRPVALGATAGTLPFHRMRGTQFNSLRPPDPAQPAYLREANTVVTTIEVPVQRLDDLASDLPPPDRCFVKIDTQGFDLEVLAGWTGLSLPRPRAPHRGVLPPHLCRWPRFPRRARRLRRGRLCGGGFLRHLTRPGIPCCRVRLLDGSG
jgi:FkbM family methyltransferase